MLCPAEVGFAGARGQTVDILGFSVLAGSRQQILDELWQRLELRAFAHVVTLNPEMMELACRDPRKRAILNTADFMVADGVGLVWAAQTARRVKITRYPGIDLAADLLSRLAVIGGSVYLLGSTTEVVEEAGRRLTLHYPGLRIAGCADGFFSEAEASGRAADVKEAAPDVLLVGMGFPKQEEFISRFRNVMGVPLMIGVGGAFEVFAGRKTRAPKLLRVAGLEWAYRTTQDVSRLKRLGVLPRFVWLVFKEAVGRRK